MVPGKNMNARGARCSGAEEVEDPVMVNKNFAVTNPIGCCAAQSLDGFGREAQWIGRSDVAERDGVAVIARARRGSRAEKDGSTG